MAYKITLIPGDGIGPEVTQATVRILEATGVKFEWETFKAGAEAFEKYHEYIPKELTESIERTRVGLKGPVTTPVGGGFASINVALRKKFELYANFRPIRNLPHIPTRYPDVDLIIVRENTESLYSGLEHEVVPGVVESLKIITEKASTRIARFAFEYARKNKRKKIHAIHKANIMKLSDGLFLRCCPHRRQGISRDHLRRAHRRQHLHATGDESLPVRHAGDGESLRRHYFRSVRGVRGRTGIRAQRESRRSLRDFRGGSRFGSRYCGQESGESDRDHALCPADAASSRASTMRRSRFAMRWRRFIAPATN